MQIHTMKIYTENLVNDPGKTPKGKPVEEISLFIISLQTKIQFFTIELHLSLLAHVPRKSCQVPSETQMYGTTLNVVWTTINAVRNLELSAQKIKCSLYIIFRNA